MNPFSILHCCVIFGMMSSIAGRDASAGEPAPLPDGIYAIFQTTMGSFTGRLDYVAAPVTVANFVSLATAERAWQDPVSGIPMGMPLYDDRTFYRVVAGSRIETGSPSESGLDGPGYAFADETNNGLSHDAAGVLSMANTGLHSNGSRFAIMLAPAPARDGLHTVFGAVIGGIDVVQAIGTVAVDGTQRPLADVRITSVTILRIGAAAEAFDVLAQGLPIVDGVTINQMTVTPTITTLAYTPQSNALYTVMSTTDLSTFTRQNGPAWYGEPDSSSIFLTSSASAGMPSIFGLTAAYYQTPLTTPATFAGRTLTLSFTGINDGTVLQTVFDLQGGGTYALTTSSGGTSLGAIVEYAYLQEPLRGRFEPIIYDGIPTLIFDLDTSTPTSNAWSGEMIPSGAPPFRVEGTYTISP